MKTKWKTIGLLAFAIMAIFAASAGVLAQQSTPDAHQFFTTSDKCQACHNNLEVENGNDLSIGVSWRGTMMSASAVDPYWLAGVRREITDHPSARKAIEDKCSTCHMPMARFARHFEGETGRVFVDAESQIATIGEPDSPLAMDGVSCAMCHQIKSDGLGSEDSFTGGFVVDTEIPSKKRLAMGPYKIEKGTKRVMRSASRFEPEKARHLRKAEFCASCHTLYTHALDEQGNETVKFPEQVPYLEWRHSAYAKEGGSSCQDCHMERAKGPTAISSVLGKPREEFAKHSFRGGNFLMLHIISQNRLSQAAQALPSDFDTSIRNTQFHLETRSGAIEIDVKSANPQMLDLSVRVENLAGHKLPTGYPSRRVWISLSVTDGDGKNVFESGALRDDGSVSGNDNDEDPLKLEPHYERITRGDQVQIYEAIMMKAGGQVTTGLLEAVAYAKDNRLLPKGFDKSTAEEDVKVRGKAADDRNFSGQSDTVRYTVDVSQAKGPLTAEAKLFYQPIGFRWARNLEQYDADEPKAFIKMYDALTDKKATAAVLGEATVTFSAPQESQPVVGENEADTD